jgi:hypothetical protein
MAIHVEHDEEGIPPGPCVIVFGQADAVGLLRGVSGVEAVREGVGVIVLTPERPPHPQVVGRVQAQVVAVLAFMIPQAEVEGDGMADGTQEGSVVQVQLGQFGGGDGERQVVVAEGIPEGDHEVRPVVRLVLEHDLVHAPDALLVVEVLVRLEGEGERPAGFSLCGQRVLRCGAVRRRRQRPVTESVPVAGVGQEV